MSRNDNHLYPGSFSGSAQSMRKMRTQNTRELQHWFSSGHTSGPEFTRPKSTEVLKQRQNLTRWRCKGVGYQEIRSTPKREIEKGVTRRESL